jgi:hypothetical protein
VVLEELPGGVVESPDVAKQLNNLALLCQNQAKVSFSNADDFNQFLSIKKWKNITEERSRFMKTKWETMIQMLPR